MYMLFTRFDGVAYFHLHSTWESPLDAHEAGKALLAQQQTKLAGPHKIVAYRVSSVRTWSEEEQKWS